MKNTEWGAVAYLQHSKYGSMVSVRNNNNNAYKTGYASVEEPTLGYNSINNESVPGNLNGTTSDVTQPYNTEIGYTASTTGNISGIYDISGGAQEYVMGYNIYASTIGGDSGITNIYSDFFESSEWERYYDKYSNSAKNSSDYQSGILGDATREMGPFQDVKNPDELSNHRSSWYSDLAHFVHPNRSWFSRGGYWAEGIESGAFSFGYNTGKMFVHLSFRVVLAP